MNALVEKLVAARRANVQFNFESGLCPKDADEAYAAQAAVAARLAASVAGWKVGVDPDETAFAAPVHTCGLHVDAASLRIPTFEPVKVEAELAIRLARDLPPRARPYSRSEILDATDALCVGFELVRSRFFSPSAPSFFARIADAYNNYGFVMGDATHDVGSVDLLRLRVRFSIDGKQTQDAVASHQMGDPMAPVLAWANAQRDRLGGLRAGQFVTTGTLIVPEPIRRPARLAAEIEGVGTVSTAFVEA